MPKGKAASQIKAMKIGNDAVSAAVGKWQVREAGSAFWTWEYALAPNGTITWRDRFNGKRGYGTWSFTKTSVFIDWSPSGSSTREEWPLPLKSAEQPGATNKNDKTTADKV